MPVRINLKELFGSDSQTITIDKLNFNFNKLLELGIGLEGVRGITGGTGSIGPSGTKGDQGDRGNQWFVGTSDPNQTTFPGLMDEDFYVLSDNSQIWQYDESSDTWNIIVDLGGIVNNYLNTAGVTFVRGFGEGSPQDSRYIMFPNRGNTIIDQQGDIVGSGVSNNDILMLSNFNETLQGIVLDIDDDLSNTDAYYSAIQKIYVDSTFSPNKRYHLELGSLNDVSGTGSPYNLSTLAQNLKLRHEYRNGIYNGVFSLTKTETSSPANITHNGIFDFQYPIFNMVGPINKEGYIQMGSRYAHLAMGNSYVEFDGINFKTSPNINAGIGIGYNFDNILPNINGNSYLIITADGNVNGIMLDTNTYQDNGNIEQLGTGPLTVHPVVGSGPANVSFGSSTYGLGGIAISGNRVIQASSSTSTAHPAILMSDPSLEGYMFVSDLNNSNSPIPISTYNGTGLSSNASGLLPVGAGISDIEVNGDLIYAITNLQVGAHSATTVGSNVYARVNFQIIKFDAESGDDFTAVSQLVNSQLDGAHRIKLNGSRAVIVTNHLRGWGDPSGSASTSQFDANGKIVAVSIINEEDTDPVAITSQNRTHHLDLEIANNKAYTVSIEFNAPIGINHPGFGVSVRSYDLDEVVNGSSPIGISLGTESTYNIVAPNSTNINSANSNDLTAINKFGAIAVSGDIIWAIHKNILYTLRQDSVTGSFIPINILAYHDDVNVRAMDIEVVGDSIYILCSSGNQTLAYSPTNSHLVKLNANNVSSPTIVSTTDIGEPSSSRLVIDGNNIYTNKTNGNTGYLIPIEVNGFKSGAIKIGSIKTHTLNATNDLKVGNILNVGQALNVGKGGIKAIGPVTSSNVLSNRVGINKDFAELDINDFSLQVSGNTLMHNTHVAGTTKLHFNSSSANIDTEIINLSPNGRVTIQATSSYPTTNSPQFSGLMRIIGGGDKGIYIYTPDSTGADNVGDIKIRPGDYVPPVPLPGFGQPPYYKEGVIVFERRVQVLNNELESSMTGTQTRNELYINTNDVGSWMFLDIKGTGGYTVSSLLNSLPSTYIGPVREWDRMIRFEIDQIINNYQIWVKYGESWKIMQSQLILASSDFGNLFTTTFMVPACCQFAIRIKPEYQSQSNQITFEIPEYSTYEVRFGRNDGGCPGNGNQPIPGGGGVAPPPLMGGPIN